MNFVLKNADFSAIRIGKKTILDNDVKNYVQVTGSTHATEINNFVVGLKEKGLYAKFETILIPANGADTFSKAFVNLKDLAVFDASGADSDIIAGYGYNLENAAKSIKLLDDCHSNSLHLLIAVTDYAVNTEQNAGFHIYIDNDYPYKGLGSGPLYYKNIAAISGNNWTNAQVVSTNLNCLVCNISQVGIKRVGQFGKNSPTSLYTYNSSTNSKNQMSIEETTDIVGDLCMGSKSKEYASADSYPYGVKCVYGLIMVSKEVISDEDMANLQEIATTFINSL